MSDFLGELQKRTAQEVETRVNALLPNGMDIKLNPPEEFDDDDLDDDDLDDVFTDPDVPDDHTSLAFEDTTDGDQNLACAVSAWRLLSFPGAVVASGPDGRAFFGTLIDLHEYASNQDLSIEDFAIYTDYEDLISMEYDHDTLKTVLRMMDQDEEGVEQTEKMFNKFHWGDHASTISAVNIPGVTGPLTFLGVGRRIEYGSKKNGKWEEYYHLFGENSQKFPQIYAVSDPNDPNEKYPKTIVIHGGEMRVEGRGIVE